MRLHEDSPHHIRMSRFLTHRTQGAGHLRKYLEEEYGHDSFAALLDEGGTSSVQAAGASERG